MNIVDVGGIQSLSLNFNDRMNLLCGPNGIGKTTILESIAHLFYNGQTLILKRNVASETSKIIAEVDLEGVNESIEINLNTFIPEEPSIISGLIKRTSGLFSLKTQRTFQYQSLQAVTRDSDKNNQILWNDAIFGINLSEIKNWFVNRYLYSAHKEALSIQQLNNFELAKKCFSLLNKDFSFSKVSASSNEILINTPNGEIYYEYLSSGFKSIISILFGIIKEIEYRFKEPNINAEDFKGIILIDEIELHLHPEWQGKILEILLEVFPKAQFFASTHSPHVIQTAEPQQIIALGLDNNTVIQRELPSSEFGFQGWTIEEILSDVMGMNNLRTDVFKEQLSEFDKAIEEENPEKAEKIFNKLDILLHPKNNLRKLLKFQIAGIR